MSKITDIDIDNFLKEYIKKTVSSFYNAIDNKEVCKPECNFDVKEDDLQNIFINSSVKLLDVMGNDLTVVNAARVSFDIMSDQLTERDKKLIAFLAVKRHEMPFAHPQLSFMMTVPVFVERQLFKHKIGLVENSISRRYVSSEPSFYKFDTFRKKSENKKQGSHLTETVDLEKFWYDYESLHNEGEVIHQPNELVLASIKGYKALLDLGVAPEQARAILPQSMMTSFIWTGSLLAFIRVCKLRIHEDAQKETQEVVEMLFKVLKEKFPHSIKAWFPNE